MRSTSCWRRISSRGAARALAAIVVVAPVMALAASGVRYVPPSPDAVLVTLDDRDARDPSLAARRRALGAAPGDAAAAAELADALLARYAVTGDPRFAGYAEAALAPWAEAAAPPPEVWLQRARLDQVLHRFRAAGEDLERLLATHPRSTSAMLLAADAWRRAGDIPRARRHCLRLQLAGRGDAAVLCAADLELSLGDPERAFELASRAVPSGASDSDPPFRSWALTVVAEAASAAGYHERARAAYEEALAALPRAPLALALAYVDRLLDEADVGAAVERLADLPAADAVLLRRARVAVLTRDTHFPAARRLLARRFEAAAVAGTAELHWRERALFELDVENDPLAALDYAERNWAVQKGAEDAALLIRSAQQAGRPAAARVVREWRDEQRRGTG